MKSSSNCFVAGSSFLLSTLLLHQVSDNSKMPAFELPEHIGAPILVGVASAFVCASFAREKKSLGGGGAGRAGVGGRGRGASALLSHRESPALLIRRGALTGSCDFFSR